MTAERLLTGADSAGAISATTYLLRPGEGTEGQTLPVETALYVLAGELTVRLGDEVVRAGPDTAVFAPSGTPHAVVNLASEDARHLQLCAPAAEPAATAAASLEPGAARRLEPVPRGINVAVRGADSSGRIAVMDNAAAPDFAGPPLHHHDFDELFFVTEGELTYQLGEEIVRRRAGGFAFAPRGAHHTWANHSGAPGRQLIVCTPAGLESYFARMAAERAGVQPPAWADDPVPETTVVGGRIPRAQ
jgi:quercetin dioxygenase-like cupin family protein